MSSVNVAANSRGGTVRANSDKNVRVNSDKYNQLKRELGELRLLKRKWEEEKMSLWSRVRKTEDALKRKKIYRGRNNTKVSGFDQDEHAMNMTIGTFVRMNVFPKTKFLHSSWSEFAPEAESSFFYKLHDELQFPNDIGAEVFWTDKVVPIVNKKLCETRANIASVVRSGYIRMFKRDLTRI